VAKPVSSSPFQAMEEEAYHAFREWPLLLVMRQKALAMHLATVAATPAPSGETDAPAVDPRSAKQLELITRE
jgi:hypothetical protein